MKETLLYQKLGENQVQCEVCAQHCLILPGKRGLCGVRENQDGVLYSLNYGQLISESIDPIEKKPIFNFLPGTFTYSIATVGCNLRCDNCQNWQISQYPKLENGKIIGENKKPDEIVESAIINNCPSISYTYTEPTIFVEFALDVMKLAHKKGLKNIWVSNGYMSKKTRQAIIPYLDAINIDLKFFNNKNYLKYCGCRLDPILESLKDFKKNKIHVEVTTLIVPTLSDQEDTFNKISKFICNKLGPDTPWHISRFSPEISYKLQNLYDTPIEKLKLAKKIGTQNGLKNIYLGNI